MVMRRSSIDISIAVLVKFKSNLLHIIEKTTLLQPLGGRYELTQSFTGKNTKGLSEHAYNTCLGHLV
jgi:hypothetical protein